MQMEWFLSYVFKYKAAAGAFVITLIGRRTRTYKIERMKLCLLAENSSIKQIFQYPTSYIIKGPKLRLIFIMYIVWLFHATLIPSRLKGLYVLYDDPMKARTPTQQGTCL